MDTQNTQIQTNKLVRPNFLRELDEKTQEPKLDWLSGGGEIADFIRKGNIVASADTKGVSQARVAINAVVNFLEKRTKILPHTILIKLGLVDQSTFAKYEFDTSIAPSGYVPLLSYVPNVVE